MIYIFEPHGDDALISCFPILKNRASETQVITVGDSRDSARLVEHFPGLRTHYEGCYEIPNQIGRAAFNRNFKVWKQGTFTSTAMTPWEWQLQITKGVNGELWKEAWDITNDFVRSRLKFINDERVSWGCRKDLVMAPVGLLHPYHICLADVLRLAVPDFPDLEFGFYAEAPYNSAQWVREIEWSHPLLIGKYESLARAQGTNVEDIKVKERVFRDVYPTEVKIFRFTRKEVLENDTWFYLPGDWSFVSYENS